MLEFFKNIPPIYLLIVGGIFVFYFVSFFWNNAHSKKKKSSFFEENPNASVIHVKKKQKGLKSVIVELTSIDDKYPSNFFQNGFNYSYGILPGQHILEATAQTTRPGVMYKSVSYTYGPTKLEVTIEPKKAYVLDFDSKNETFTFTEDGERA